MQETRKTQAEIRALDFCGITRRCMPEDVLFTAFQMFFGLLSVDSPEIYIWGF
jgi:hypothetical protein